MARFTQGGGSGDGSALNYVQNKVSSPVPVTGFPTIIASLDITTTGKPVQVSVTGEGANAQAGSWVRLNIYRDDQPIGNEIQIEASAVSENVPYAINVIDEVSAGLHTYQAIITSMSSGNWMFGEASGPILNAVELTGFKGDTGPRGLQGIQGIQGEQGPAGDSADLVVPTAIKDQNDADFITFEKTGTGTARIATPQDDLSLRSARDITLFAGSDGPGNVYIGWGDAVYTPDSPNRVATMGDIQSANIADFIFTNNDEFESTISLPDNKRMRIESGASNDLYLIGGDDVFIEADDDLYLRTVGEGDDIHLEAADDIRFSAGLENETHHSWRMNSEGELELPNNAEIHTTLTQVEGEERQRTSVVITTDGSAGGSELDQAKFIFGKNGAYFNTETNDNKFATIGDVQSLVSTFVPLPNFLTYIEGREALPTINENFGWNSTGLWFGPTAVDSDSNASYPVFTNFTLNQTDKVFVRFNVDIDENCSDAGICVFPDGTVPNWTWGSDATRIAAQFNCPSMEIHGTTISTSGSTSVPAQGTYRIEFTYDPTLEIDNVKFEYFELGSNVAIGSMTLSQVLPSGNYRIGFASDNDVDNGEGGPDSPLNRTYISDLFISVNNGENTYSNTLQNGNSGEAANIADFSFTYDSDDDESRMTIHNHDMRIQTTRDDTQDADIDINSADDIWITANDDIEITSNNGEVRIYANGEEDNGWAFRPDGVIAIGKTTTGIEVKDGDDVKGLLKFDTENGQAILQAYSNNQTTSFTTSDWYTALWTTIDPYTSQVTITDTPNILNFMGDIGFNVDFNVLKVSVNGQGYGNYGGASSGDGAITIYITNSIPGVEPVTVTDISFQYAFASKVDIDFDEGDMLLKTQGGMKILLESSENIHAKAEGDVVLTSGWTAQSNDWRFDNDGVIIGPGVGGLTSFTKIAANANDNTGENIRIGDDAWIGDLNTANHIAITGVQDPTSGGIILGNTQPGTISVGEGDMSITSGGAMTIEAVGGDMNFYMDGGMYIGPSESGNQIVKMSQLDNYISPTMVRYQPTFAATGLAFTGSGATHPTYNSYYVKAGKMVTFVIEVDCSTVTNFGTGQYTLELPFAPAIGYNHFSGWAQVDTAVNPDVPNGHVVLNVDHAGLTTTLDLHYLKQAGGAHTPIVEGLFLQGTPVTLTTSSKIYINGTYICQ